jgi:hypothetical protein
MVGTKKDEAAVYAKLIARAWREPAFKAKLIADPQTTLKDAGVTLPAGVTVKVVENTDTHVHVVLPPKPVDELSDEALEKAAGGWGDQPCITLSYQKK